MSAGIARAMWWALAFVALASGARYGDYAEVKMPEYGSAIDYDGPRDSPPALSPEVDDYHDAHEHAHDAPAPMEYKYEEDRGKSDKRIKEIGDSDERQNSVIKHKKYLENENQENFDAYGSDESNFKSNHRPSKHRPRLKPRRPQSEDLSAAHVKHAVRYGRNRKKDISLVESKESMDDPVDDFEDEKSIDFEEDQKEVQKNHRETTVRTARRKPRDRFIEPEPPADEEDPIMNIRRRPVKDEFRPEDVTHARSVIRRSQYRQGARPRAKTGSGQRGGYLPKKYDDYAEYYDMKRVQGIKEKLLRENIDENIQPSTIRSFPMRSRSRPRARLRDDDDDDNSEDTGLEGLRRLMNPLPSIPAYDNDKEQDEPDEPPPSMKMISSSYAGDIETTDVSVPPPVDPALRMVISKRPATETTTTTVMTTTTTTVMTKTTPINTTPIKTTITTPLTPETTTVEEEEDEEIEIPKSTTTELSLAEKSRLSILKKAQRKEMLKESVTKKPPVLLQVTNRLHTLVMVEPATKIRPWQSVNEVLEDSPENLLKVKRLMRKKLVENAKDIHDLSENWDDMICDYVDMALIDKQAAATTSSLNTILMILSFMTIVLL